MLEFVVVGEAAADARIVCDLADRVVAEEGPDWIRDQERDYFLRELLPGLRRWSGLDPGQGYSTWREVRRFSKNYPQLTFLRRSTTPARMPDYAPARKAILLAGILRQGHFPDALMLIRDLDSQPERRSGMMKARDEEASTVVIVATPNPKREAWVLNGFVCQTPREEERLETIRDEINFDPCREAHRLRYASQGSQAARDPKRILARLTADSPDREAQCWMETPLTILRERGEETILKDFLDQVRSALLRLFSKP